MRRLILSSNGSFVIEKGLGLLFDDVSKIELAYITTASKGAKDKSYIKEHKNKLQYSGINFEEIDIEGKNENELRCILKDKNAIWVEGGNTFYLLKAVRECGFDKIIKELIEQSVVYIGSSAGSYIMCPTIEMSTWKKPGEEKEQFGVNDLTALSFVPFLIKAHYNPELKDFLKEKIAGVKYPVKFLQDGQAILVEGEDYKLIGKGEEIKL